MKRLGLAASLVCAGALLMPALALAGCTDLPTGTETTAATTTTITGATQELSDTGTTGVGGVTATTKKPVTTTTGGSTAVSFEMMGTIDAQLAYPTTTLPTWTRFEENDHHLLYSGPWASFNNPVLSGGWAQAAYGPSSVTVKFEGTQIRFISVTDYRNCTARLTMDGGQTYLFDTYGPTFGMQLIWTSPALPYGTHTLFIQQTDIANGSSATYKYLQLDAVDVKGALVSP
jgi:hypothetical protein